MAPDWSSFVPKWHHVKQDCRSISGHGGLVQMTTALADWDVWLETEWIAC
jgi:hypothetical protein